MKNNTDTSALSLLANEAGYDPIEDRLRENFRAALRSKFTLPLTPTQAACA